MPNIEAAVVPSERSRIAAPPRVTAQESGEVLSTLFCRILIRFNMWCISPEIASCKNGICQMGLSVFFGVGCHQPQMLRVAQASVCRMPVRLRLSRRVQPPQREAQDGGKGHPGQIRHEQPTGRPMDTMEAEQRQQDVGLPQPCTAIAIRPPHLPLFTQITRSIGK